MNKLRQSLLLIIIVLVCAASNILLFALAPSTIMETAVFWTVWAFMTFVGLGAAIGLHFWGTRKGAGDMVSLVVVYYVSGIFFALYVLAAFLFTFKLWFLPYIVVLAVELVLTIAYIIVAIFALGGAEYMRKEAKHTKEKVMYIRLLKADVDDCATNATNAELRKALNDFAENVRFSDPMSHPSLAGIEAELSSIVAEIAAKIGTEAEADALVLVEKAQKSLEMRNSRCLILK